MNPTGIIDKVKNNKIKYPWILIFLMFVVFLPAGLYLFHARTTQEEAASPEAYRKTQLSGLIVTILGIALFAASFLLKNELYRYYAAVIPLVGIGILIYSLSVRKRGMLYKLYNPIIREEGIHDLNVVAQRLGKEYPVVQKEVVNLIVHNLFLGARIDIRTRNIYFPDQTTETA